LALGLTFLAAILVALPLRVEDRLIRVLSTVFWALFSIAWFTVGLGQIADGLL
jgi:hypothetical protein